MEHRYDRSDRNLSFNHFRQVLNSQDLIMHTSSGIISSVITYPSFMHFVNNPDNYASLSGAVVSTFTGPFKMVFYAESLLRPLS